MFDVGQRAMYSNGRRSRLRLLVHVQEECVDRRGSGHVAMAWLTECVPISADGTQDVMRVVDAVGALHVSLNPVTAAAVRKRLIAVAAEEGVTIGTPDAERIADASSGDLRSALETLHILCCGKSMKTAMTASKVKRDLPAWKMCKPDITNVHSESQ